MQDFPYWIFLAGISWLGCLVRLLVGLGVGLAEGSGVALGMGPGLMLADCQGQGLPLETKE